MNTGIVTITMAKAAVITIHFLRSVHVATGSYISGVPPWVLFPPDNGFQLVYFKEDYSEEYKGVELMFVNREPDIQFLLDRMTSNLE